MKNVSERRCNVKNNSKKKRQKKMKEKEEVELTKDER